MNILRTKSRVNINYSSVLDKMIEKSVPLKLILKYLLIELTTLQKYILELLVDRIEQQIKLKGLING